MSPATAPGFCNARRSQRRTNHCSNQQILCGSDIGSPWEIGASIHATRSNVITPWGNSLQHISPLGVCFRDGGHRPERRRIAHRIWSRNRGDANSCDGFPLAVLQHSSDSSGLLRRKLRNNDGNQEEAKHCVQYSTFGPMLLGSVPRVGRIPTYCRWLRLLRIGRHPV